MLKHIPQNYKKNTRKSSSLNKHFKNCTSAFIKCKAFNLFFEMFRDWTFFISSGIRFQIMGPIYLIVLMPKRVVLTFGVLKDASLLQWIFSSLSISIDLVWEIWNFKCAYYHHRIITRKHNYITGPRVFSDGVHSNHRCPSVIRL